MNGQQVLEMAATGHPNSLIDGDVVLSMTSLRSDIVRYTDKSTIECFDGKYTSACYCQLL